MSSGKEDLILGLPRRPRNSDASAAALIAAIAGGLLTGGWGGAVLGGVVGGALANQPQPLEMAVREHFAKLGLEVIFFYRSPRSVKVTFRYRPSAFWTIESVMPDDLHLSQTDAEDWLYGDLITNALPNALQQIQPLTA
ncbi:MAG: hypothetical protein WBP93_17690 [Pyrinomonadaceae bacterium]